MDKLKKALSAQRPSERGLLSPSGSESAASLNPILKGTNSSGAFDLIQTTSEMLETHRAQLNMTTTDAAELSRLLLRNRQAIEEELDEDDELYGIRSPVQHAFGGEENSSSPGEGVAERGRGSPANNKMDGILSRLKALSATAGEMDLSATAAGASEAPSDFVGGEASFSMQMDQSLSATVSSFPPRGPSPPGGGAAGWKNAVSVLSPSALTAGKGLLVTADVSTTSQASTLKSVISTAAQSEASKRARQLIYKGVPTPCPSDVSAQFEWRRAIIGGMESFEADPRHGVKHGIAAPTGNNSTISSPTAAFAAGPPLLIAPGTPAGSRIGSSPFSFSYVLNSGAPGEKPLQKLNALDSTQLAKLTASWWCDAETKAEPSGLQDVPDDLIMDCNFPSKGFYKSFLGDDSLNFCWNTRFQEAINMPAGDARTAKLSTLIENFCNAAVPVANYLLVNIQCLPSAVMHLEGITYVIYGAMPGNVALFPDVADVLDRNKITLREYNARKAAAAAAEPNLCVPFSIVIQVLGTNLLAFPRLPVGEITLTEEEKKRSAKRRRSEQRRAATSHPSGPLGVSAVGEPRAPADLEPSSLVSTAESESDDFSESASSSFEGSSELDGILPSQQEVTPIGGGSGGGAAATSAVATLNEELVYGVTDVTRIYEGEVAILTTDRQVNASMQHLAGALHLKGHWIGRSISAKAFFHGPVTMQVFRSRFDNRYYLSNFGRMTPPTPDDGEENLRFFPYISNNAYLVQLFRPELLKDQINFSLSSDCGSHLQVVNTDQDDEERQKAYTHLMKYVMGEAAKQVARDSEMNGVTEEHLLECNGISRFLHKWGMNLRYLPLFRERLTRVPFSALALLCVEVEIVVRAMKVWLLSRSRTMAAFGLHVDRNQLCTLLRAALVPFSEEYWESIVIPAVKMKYGEATVETLMRERIPHKLFAPTLCQRLGARCSKPGEGLLQGAALVAAWASSNVSSIEFTFRPIVRCPPVPAPPFREGQEMACMRVAKRHLQNIINEVQSGAGLRVDKPMMNRYIRFLQDIKEGRSTEVQRCLGLDFSEVRQKKEQRKAVVEVVGQHNIRYRLQDGRGLRVFNISKEATDPFRFRYGQRVQHTLGAKKGTFSTIIGVLEDTLWRHDDGTDGAEEVNGRSFLEIVANYGFVTIQSAQSRSASSPIKSSSGETSKTAAEGEQRRSPTREKAKGASQGKLMRQGITDPFHYLGERSLLIMERSPTIMFPIYGLAHGDRVQFRSGPYAGRMTTILGAFEGHVYHHVDGYDHVESWKGLDKEALQREYQFAVFERSRPVEPFPMEPRPVYDENDNLYVSYKHSLAFGFYYRQLLLLQKGPHAGKRCLVVGIKGTLLMGILDDPYDSNLIVLGDSKEQIVELHGPKVLGVSSISPTPRQPPPTITYPSSNGEELVFDVSAAICVRNGGVRGQRIKILKGIGCGRVGVIIGWRKKYLWAHMEDDSVGCEPIHAGTFCILDGSVFTSEPFATAAYAQTSEAAEIQAADDGDSATERGPENIPIIQSYLTFFGEVVEVNISPQACDRFSLYHGQRLLVKASGIPDLLHQPPRNGFPAVNEIVQNLPTRQPLERAMPSMGPQSTTAKLLRSRRATRQREASLKPPSNDSSPVAELPLDLPGEGDASSLDSTQLVLVTVIGIFAKELWYQVAGEPFIRAFRGWCRWGIECFHHPIVVGFSSPSPWCDMFCEAAEDVTPSLYDRNRIASGVVVYRTNLNDAIGVQTMKDKVQEVWKLWYPGLRILKQESIITVNEGGSMKHYPVGPHAIVVGVDEGKVYISKCDDPVEANGKRRVYPLEILELPQWVICEKSWIPTTHETFFQMVPESTDYFRRIGIPRPEMDFEMELWGYRGTEEGEDAFILFPPSVIDALRRLKEDRLGVTYYDSQGGSYNIEKMTYRRSADADVCELRFEPARTVSLHCHKEYGIPPKLLSKGTLITLEQYASQLHLSEIGSAPRRIPAASLNPALQLGKAFLDEFFFISDDAHILEAACSNCSETVILEMEKEAMELSNPLAATQEVRKRLLLFPEVSLQSVLQWMLSLCGLQYHRSYSVESLCLAVYVAEHRLGRSLDAPTLTEYRHMLMGRLNQCQSDETDLREQMVQTEAKEWKYMHRFTRAESNGSMRGLGKKKSTGIFSGSMSMTLSRLTNQLTTLVKAKKNTQEVIAKQHWGSARPLLSKHQSSDRYVLQDATVITFMPATGRKFQRGDVVRYNQGDVTGIEATILGIHEGQLWRYEHTGEQALVALPFEGSDAEISRRYGLQIVRTIKEPSQIRKADVLTWLAWDGTLKQFTIDYDTCTKYNVLIGERYAPTSETPPHYPYSSSVLVIVGVAENRLWFAVDQSGAIPFPENSNDPINEFKLRCIYSAPLQQPVLLRSSTFRCYSLFSPVEAHWVDEHRTIGAIFNINKTLLEQNFGVKHMQRFACYGGLMNGKKIVIVGVRCGKLWAIKEGDSAARELPGPLASFVPKPLPQDLRGRESSLPLPTKADPTGSGNFHLLADPHLNSIRFPTQGGAICYFDISSNVSNLFGLVPGQRITYLKPLAREPEHSVPMGRKRRALLEKEKSKKKITALGQARSLKDFEIPLQKCHAICVGLRRELLWKIDDGDSYATPFLSCPDRSTLFLRHAIEPGEVETLQSQTG